MALSISLVPLMPKGGGTFKGKKVKLVTFAGDAVMPSGGYVVPASSLDMKYVIGAAGQAKDNDGWDWVLRPSAETATGSASFTLLPHSAYSAAATASQTVLSTRTCVMLVIGY